MTDFEKLREDLQKARQAAADARTRARTSLERMAKLVDRDRVLARTAGDPKSAAERKKVAAALEEARVSSSRLQAEASKLAATEAAALAAFAKSADPRSAIGNWNDRIPILMMPVRLETRFVQTQGAAELLVRVYPDDCSIDGFEPTLSEAEVKSAKNYWLAVYAAGGDPDGERGAWRTLASGYGSGRAEFIVSTFAPLPVPAKPVKAAPTDLVLTIGTDDPPTDADAAALRDYWTAVWLAAGDRAATDAARANLVGAIGDAARADSLVEVYVPSNLKAPFVAGIGVQTTFVVFPTADDLRRRSWSRAATAELVPDRFVFIAFNGGAQEIVQLGMPVTTPLVVSPDPSAPDAERLRHGPDGEVIYPDSMQWMVDFDRAVSSGMGFRIKLTDAQLSRGFERILVIGLRLSADEQQAQEELEALITHQRFSRAGYSIVSQGTPTNNTDDGPSGWSRTDDPDASFDALTKDRLFDETASWLDKSDGQWLAELLGIETSTVAKIANSGGRDQADARLMNIALWPATLGYWMQTMMSPAFADGAVDDTRAFFSRFVSGRGPIPAVRIGSQPYGILPATAFSRMTWPNPVSEHTEAAFVPPFVGKLYAILKAMMADWRTMSQSVSYVGKAGDPHALLLDIVGLHSGSVEFSQRYAESAEQLYNRLNLDGLGFLLSPLIVAGLEQRAADLLSGRFGYAGGPVDLMTKFFTGEDNALTGPVIDDRPLSETAPIRKYTADGTENYIEWLIGAANQSLDTLYQQQGFANDAPPEALLYLMLRHALQLGYYDTSVQLHLGAGLLTAATARTARLDDTFINIRQVAKPFESKYGLLYTPEPAITGDTLMTVGDYIGRNLRTIGPGSALRDQLDALDRLKSASTARLERAFSEHVDCCSYRLDAWLVGLVLYQLTLMRNVSESTKGQRREGIYVGAYAWLENLKPDRRVLTPVEPDDPALAEDFANGPPLQRDSTNEGYVFAPSLNHAVTAAVLRNGFIANASPANPTSLAVTVTSSRVRRALGILEGIRGGQSLGALLGYGFERGLHDDHAFGVELDQFIFKLRREFPLAGNRMASTQIDSDDLAIESVEARNVVDGLALVNHIRTTGNRAYPFGKSRLPRGTVDEENAINAEVDALFEVWDAVADMALSEGVFQAMVGNYDRVASTMDAYSKGNFPPEPLVVRSPTNGLGLTLRVAVHFEPGVAAAGATPRAAAEPALDRWIGSVLPSFGDVGCLVDYRDAANAPQTLQVRLSDLSVGPFDVLQLFREDKDRSLAELDERIMILIAPLARPDGAVSIRYMDKGAAALSIFEASALVRHIRRLVTAARPLRNTDLALSREAERSDDADVFIDRARITDPRAALSTLLADFRDFDTNELTPNLDDPAAHRDVIVSKIDRWIDSVVSPLARAALFSIPQSGWGFAYDTRARIFADIVQQAQDLVTRWNQHLTDYDTAIVAYDALDPATPDDDRLKKLMSAERLISTKFVTPVPTTPAAYRTALGGKRTAFVAKRDQFVQIVNTNRQKLSDLTSDVAARLPTDDYEFPPLSIDDALDRIVALAEDIQRVVGVMARECDRRGAAADDLVAQHDATGVAATRVKVLSDAAKALFGEDFVMFPEFSLGADQGTELASSYGATDALLAYAAPSALDSPVDTWLCGVARVREQMGRWEKIVMLAESFGSVAPVLRPLQLPFDTADSWLGLEFPSTIALDHERLLYTASFSKPFDATVRQCGMLIDEWSEVIPADQATTGLTFHFDRPNHEAPQTMLLLTPTAFRGAWQWADVVDALNDTLDLAKLRAVEPVHVDGTAYSQFLPATVMAVTMNQLTISANLAINNRLARMVNP